MASRNFRKDTFDGDGELSRKQNQWRRKGQRGHNTGDAKASEDTTTGDAKAAGRSYWRRENS